VIVLSGVLCAALSLCCDDWVGDTVAPIWLRFVEAGGCGLVMAVGIVLMYSATDLLPKDMSPWALVLPPLLGLLIGGWVPHIYRSAHRAAMSERGNGRALPVGQAIAQARVTSLPTLADAAWGLWGLYRRFDDCEALPGRAAAPLIQGQSSDRSRYSFKNHYLPRLIIAVGSPRVYRTRVRRGAGREN
jgi:hypothetical protein